MKIILNIVYIIEKEILRSSAVSNAYFSSFNKLNLTWS